MDPSETVDPLCEVFDGYLHTMTMMSASQADSLVNNMTTCRDREFLSSDHLVIWNIRQCLFFASLEGSPQCFRTRRKDLSGFRFATARLARPSS